MDFSLPVKKLLHLSNSVPIVLVVAVQRSPLFKGHLVELGVNASARLFLDRDNLTKNVTLPIASGLNRINHIIVSRSRVFVSETRITKGWISDNVKQRYLRQEILKHSQKFENSLHQNSKYLKTLQSLFDLNEEQMHSLIVSGGAPKQRCPIT